ncbi:hypothetical protein PG990_004012 [Apiospora arundinis]
MKTLSMSIQSEVVAPHPLITRRPRLRPPQATSHGALDDAAPGFPKTSQDFPRVQQGPETVASILFIKSLFQHPTLGARRETTNTSKRPRSASKLAKAPDQE